MAEHKKIVTFAKNWNRMNLIVNPEYSHLRHWIKEIPSFFSTQGETIYKARNEIKVFPTDAGVMVVKSFRIPHIINRFAYTFLRFSKAERSYEYSLKILQRGFQTPLPIAYIELFQSGLLSRSYYVSTHTDYLLMRNFSFNKALAGDDAEILQAFARYTARLHEKEIYPTDYSPGNILYKKEDGTIHFVLIDVNRMQFKKVTERMAYRSFSRMDFSIEMLDIVAREYALQRQMGVEKSIVEITRLNLETMKKYR